MPKMRKLKDQYHALRYHDGDRNNSVAKEQYLKWREAQVPPIPEHCDNPACRFHTEPLVWNHSPLPLILEHFNGVNTDNRPKNLRLLCPNCDSQNSKTRGGANARRTLKFPGGYARVGSDGLRQYVLPAESGSYKLTERELRLTGPDGSR